MVNTKETKVRNKNRVIFNSMTTEEANNYYPGVSRMDQLAKDLNQKTREINKERRDKKVQKFKSFFKGKDKKSEGEEATADEKVDEEEVKDNETNSEETTTNDTSSNSEDKSEANSNESEDKSDEQTTESESKSEEKTSDDETVKEEPETMESLKAQVKKLTGELSRAKSKITSQETDIEVMVEKVKIVTEDRDHFKKEYETLLKQFDELVDVSNGLGENLTVAQEELKVKDTELEGQKNLVKDLTETTNQQAKDLKASEQAVNRLERDLKAVKAELTKVKKQNTKLKSEKKTLTTEVEQLRLLKTEDTE